MHEILLEGIDGSNLLGFLAAVGTLKTLTGPKEVGPIFMGWTERSKWSPVLYSNFISSKDQLLDVLEPLVCGPNTANPSWKIGDSLTLTGVEFGEHIRLAFQTGNHDLLSRFASFGSEFISAKGKADQMSDTEFRTMSGAGHQHFLQSMVKLAELTNRQDIKSALFEKWKYYDSKPSLRWDPADYRPHALRADDPSKAAIATMRGANRLAIEALPCFPTFPIQGKLRTIGFLSSRREAVVTWPIWTGKLSLASFCSVLSLKCLYSLNQDELRLRGIEQVFRSKRFTDDKFRNFTVARELL